MTADIEWLSRDSCTTYVEQRRSELKKDEEALELMRDELMRTQKETIIQGLCKLNKDVKKLTVKEFNDTFGCDVIELIRKQMALGDVNNNVQSNSGSKKRNRSVANASSAAASNSSSSSGMVGVDSNGLSFKTPAVHTRMGGGEGGKTMRTAKKGEIVKHVSVNGSPIDQYDHGEVVVTVKKLRVGGKGGRIGGGAFNSKSNNASSSSSASSFPISIGIGAGNGEVVDLSDPNQRKNLDEKQKAAAMQQLMAIQEQMTTLMQNF